MNLKEYSKIALQKLNETIISNSEERMNYSCMGLIEESGEIVAEVRKAFYKGNFHEKRLNISDIKSELGDLIWYLCLICRDNDIEIQLSARKEKDEEVQLSFRETLIRTSIELGKKTGEIVRKYQKVYNKETNKEELAKKIKEQYENIVELANQLNITIDEILKENIRKINYRYKEEVEESK